MGSVRISEEAVAAPVVDYFSAFGAVFPEVSCWTAGDRADLVVVRDDASVDVVEVKVAPCNKLMRQIEGWRPYAERCWVAYQPPRRGEKVQRWLAAFRGQGVGVIHVEHSSAVVVLEPIEQVTSQFHRTRLVAALTPIHALVGAAGNCRGEFYTPFRHTCENLREAVSRTPGLTMREAVGQIGHHYTSDKVARSSLLQWIRKGVVDGIEARVFGREARLYAVTPTPKPAVAS